MTENLAKSKSTSKLSLILIITLVTITLIALFIPFTFSEELNFMSFGNKTVMEFLEKFGGWSGIIALSLVSSVIISAGIYVGRSSSRND